MIALVVYLSLLWECEARPLVDLPVHTYVGVGKTRLEAHADAERLCTDAGHLVCYVDRCQQFQDGDIDYD